MDYVSFEIEKGKFYIFLGLLGCGKIMILWLIVGFMEVLSGMIYFNGKRINDVLVNKW